MLARGDWSFTYTGMPCDDTDEFGNPLIDQHKVMDCPNTKVRITNFITENPDLSLNGIVRDYDLYINDSYWVHDTI